jgi:DNA-binding transcriptional LysR family regulator
VEDAFPSGKISSILNKLHLKFPAVEVELKPPMEHDLVTMLLGGEIILGLGCARANYPPGIGFRRLGNVTLVNVARHDHPLASLSEISFAQLGDHLQLLVPAQTKDVLTSEYLRSPQKWRLQSEVGLLELLKSGIGWSTVPKRLIAAELASGDLVELKLAAYPFTEWTVGLDVLWHQHARTGLVGSWLKTEICRTRVVG